MTSDTRELILDIIKRDPAVSLTMKKRLLSWLQMSEYSFREKVLLSRPLTPHEASKILGCSKQALANLADENRIASAYYSGEKRRHGYYGASLLQLLAGNSDTPKAQLSTKRPVDALLPRTRLLLSVTLTYDNEVDAYVRTKVLDLLNKEPWRFSIPTTLNRILKRQEVCAALKLQKSAVQDLIRTKKILPIIGSGNRAIGYSGPSVWRFMLAKQSQA